MLRRFPNLCYYFFVLAIFLFPDKLFSIERTLEYKSTLEVKVDGTLEVTEEITVISEGRQIKRGIFRDFPTKYKDKTGNRVKVDFIVYEVLRNGSPEPYIVQNKSNGKRIRIGNKNILGRNRTLNDNKKLIEIEVYHLILCTSFLFL